jgi:hypothetical protein
MYVEEVGTVCFVPAATPLPVEVRSWRARFKRESFLLCNNKMSCMIATFRVQNSRTTDATKSNTIQTGERGMAANLDKRIFCTVSTTATLLVVC